MVTRSGGDGLDVINTFCLIADEIILACGWAFAPSALYAVFGGDSGDPGWLRSNYFTSDSREGFYPSN